MWVKILDIFYWGEDLFINSISGFVCENFFILRLQIYIDVTKKIAFLGFCDFNITNVRSRQFTKLYLSGVLYKIPIRTGFDLGRKISTKLLFVLMQKLGFQLYETEILEKQAIPPPLWDCSNLARSYPSISRFAPSCFNWKT